MPEDQIITPTETVTASDITSTTPNGTLSPSTPNPPQDTTAADVAALKANNKNLKIWLILLIIVLVGGAVGFGVYYSQQTKLKTTEAQQQLQIDQLNSQLTQTQQAQLQKSLDAEKTKNADLQKTIDSQTQEITALKKQVADLQAAQKTTTTPKQ